MADTNPSALHSSAKAEFPCPDCGEMVREGLVRCWNCGGFLRSEMEQQFQKMQQKPARVILSGTAEPAADHADLDSMMRDRSSGSGEDDDFQISTPVKQVAAPQITGSATPTASTTRSEPAASSPATGESGTPDESAETTRDRASTAGPENQIPHSVATGGDALLELAAAEETERGKRQGSRPSAVEGVRVIRDGFLIDAPKGCRIQIRDEHTGEMRRLTFGASSRVRISMLDKLAAISKSKKVAAEKEPVGPRHLSAGKYQRWMSSLQLHTINPAKLKLVADSLAKEFTPVETGFAEDELLVVSLPAAKKGLFGGGKGPATPDAARDALLEHLRANKSLDGDDVKVAGDIKSRYTADQLAELRVVQPAASLSESLFAGIPVFGQGRIAVQLPVKEVGELPKVLSFTISQFREFVEIVGPLYSLAEFGRNLDIPLTDTFEELKCHFSDTVIKSITHLAYYNADPAIDTVLAGYRCEACGIAVSEDARNKEKLGGKAGKGIAKAKCPKCEQKMGNVPLYTLAAWVAAPSMQGDEPPHDADQGANDTPSDAAASDSSAKAPSSVSASG